MKWISKKKLQKDVTFLKETQKLIISWMEIQKEKDKKIIETFKSIQEQLEQIQKLPIK